MKTIYNLVLLLFFSISIFAQGVESPSGFNYQAVLRDADGIVLKNHKVELRIQLVSDIRSKDIIYQETHNLISDKMGIINTVIGMGSPSIGYFEDVPWSSESIWINVSYDTSNSGNFTQESFTKLMAVPYAMYAKTAGKVEGSSGRNGMDNDVPQYWTLYGNFDVNEKSNKIGTLDFVPVQFITGDEVRMVITADGNTEFYENVNVGAILSADELLVNGRSIFQRTMYGNADFELQGNLDAYSDAFFHDDLTVNENLFVLKNVNITRNLEVRRNSDFYGLVHSNLPEESLSKDDGSVIIEGGVGIEKNLNIGGNFTQDEATDEAFVGKTTVMNETESFSKDDGALLVEGGMGLEKNLNMGGNLTQDDSLNYAILGQTNVISQTNAVDPETGALIVTGGAGIGKDLYVGGDIKATGLEIDGRAKGPDDDIESYPVRVFGDEQGIAVRINQSSPDSDNNFITFFDEDNDAVGRIEGQTKIDILQSETWIVETTFQAAAIASTLGSFASQAAADVNLALEGGRFVVDFVNHVITIIGAAFGSGEAGAGVGDLVCVTIIAFIDLAYELVEGAASIAGNFVDFTVTAFDAVTNIANIIQYQTLTFLNAGSTFSSGSADYAEWLPKMDPNQVFRAGDVVGIIGGKVTSDITNAEKLMVISSDPMILGNMPDEQDEHLFEKVAFLGQVPVKVNGPVKSGDYLVASEDHQGFSKAVSPEDITLEDCKKIVGVSWGQSELHGINYVNTAIGMNNNDVLPVLENQVKEMDALKKEMNVIKDYILENEAILAELIPGYLEKKSDKNLIVNEELLLASNDDMEEMVKEKIDNQLVENNLYALVDNFNQSRRGDSYLPTDNAQIISMVNKIDNTHNLDLSYFNSPVVGPFDGIEDFANSVLNKDFVADFKAEITSAVSSAVQVVADEILQVKVQMLNEISNGAGLVGQEVTMLDEKLNEMLPIFDLMENSGQLVTDVTNDLFDLIDDAACAVCNEIDALPIKPQDVSNLVNIPVDFALETIQFFTGTINDILGVSFGVCVDNPLDIGPGEFCGPNIQPLSFLLNDLNFPQFNVNDLPFVENESLNIQFPDICASLNCN